MTNFMTIELNNGKIFETPDFALSTVLATLGFNLETLDRQNPTKVVFIFQNSPDLQATVKKYFSNQLKVNPQLLFASQKTLKTYLR
jgi:hypothetical protein